MRVKDDAPINEMAALPGDAPAITPDFTASQIYLNPAPAGIDARFAWTKPGGRGEGVTIIDCEWGWNFSHEDLDHPADRCGIRREFGQQQPRHRCSW